MPSAVQAKDNKTANGGAVDRIAQLKQDLKKSETYASGKVKSVVNRVEKFTDFYFTPEYNPVYILTSALPRFLTWLSTLGARYFTFSPPVPTFLHDDEFPTVLNVPFSERLQFYWRLATAYVPKMVKGLAVATYMAFFDYQAKPISDPQLSHVFGNTVYAKFLKQVDKVEWLSARQIPVSAPNGYWYYIADFSFVPNVKIWSDFRTSGSVGVFRVSKTAGIKVPEPVAIQLTWVKNQDKNVQVYVPGDNAWPGAKLFLMQGAAKMGSLVEHPKAHFPYDSVNAFTHHLPNGHLLKTLLWPHLKYTLALNDTVLNSVYLSIVINPLMSQTPFDAPPEELRKYLQESRETFKYVKNGVEKDNVFPYGTFLSRYHDVYMNFVGKVVDHAWEQLYTPETVKWGDQIAAIVPGFPDGKQLQDKQLFKQIIAQIMWNVSVFHGADHYTFYKIPWNQNCWRLREDPPQNPETAFDFKWAHAPIDMWKLAQTQIVFFYTGASSKLEDVNYKFRDAKLKQYALEFRAALMAVDSIKDDAHCMDLNLIGPSIDY
ncbi:hypothetical protein MP228_001040 [Amoeboaphelidium protococcarum]|nr:hypothetical protein MP228_001040 [Amoeboaphelidium protococcarum]